MGLYSFAEVENVLNLF